MSVPRPAPLDASLRELSLCSPDPAALAEYYTRALGYRFADDGRGLLGVAVDRRLRIVPGAARTLDYAGYALADTAEADALRARLRAAGVALQEEPWPGFTGNAIRFADPDGNTFVMGVAEPAPAPLSDGSPEGATAARPARLQHVVFATADIDQLLAFHLHVTGFVLSDRVSDEHGVLRTAFLRCSHEHHSLAMFQTAEARLDHHCLEAGDWNLIRDWGDHLAGEHIPLKWGPGRHGPGNNLFMFVHDLDGNWVELSAELEQVAPDRAVGDWLHEERTLNSWGIGLLRS